MEHTIKSEGTQIVYECPLCKKISTSKDVYCGFCGSHLILWNMHEIQLPSLLQKLQAEKEKEMWDRSMGRKG